MILKAIETQVGGTAEATANASDIMRVGFKQVSEEVGMALLPLFQQLVDFVTTNLLPKIKEFSVFITENQTLVRNLAIGLGVLVATLGTLSLIIKAVNIAIITFNGIVKIATILQAAFNLVLSLNPIGLVVIAVAALAAGFVLAYQKVEPFRNLIQDVINKIREMGEAIKNSAFGKAIGGIVDRVTSGKALGGMVSAGQAVRVGEMGSEVFIPGTSGQIIPNNKLGGGGSTIININGVIDAESARRSIEKLLQNSARRTSPINLIGATL
jgi:phage-related protein